MFSHIAFAMLDYLLEQKSKSNKTKQQKRKGEIKNE